MANVRSGSEFESLLLLEKLSSAGPGLEKHCIALSSFGDCEFDVDAICVLWEVTTTSGNPEVHEKIVDFLFLDR